MANRKTRTQINEMWLVWQECENEHQVAIRCSCSRATVKRYRKIERWDERLVKIKAEAAKRTDYNAAKARAENIQMARLLKGELAKAIAVARAPEKEGGPIRPVFRVDPMRPEAMINSLERIVKLEMLLLGDETERIMIVKETAELAKEFDEMLERARERLGTDDEPESA